MRDLKLVSHRKKFSFKCFISFTWYITIYISLVYNLYNVVITNTKQKAYYNILTLTVVSSEHKYTYSNASIFTNLIIVSYLPVISTRTKPLIEMMKSFVVSHNYFPFHDFGDQLRCIVTVHTDP